MEWLYGDGDLINTGRYGIAGLYPYIGSEWQQTCIKVLSRQST